MINCIIVDDEPLAREVMRLHLSCLNGWHIVQECRDAMEAYESLINHPVQVVFLDIEMPRIKGVDFLRSLKNPPLIIYTTAHSNYAVEGFELNVLDYLLKPMTFERVKQAARKAEILLQQVVPVSNEAKVPPLPVAGDDFIFIKQDAKLIKVNFQDILFVEAKRDFTQIVLRDKKLLAGFHLKMLEHMLPAALFMRVHRSFIVRLGAIEALSGNIIEMSSYNIPVSPANRFMLATALKI